MRRNFILLQRCLPFENKNRRQQKTDAFNQSVGFELGWQDSNLRIQESKSCAFTNLATPHRVGLKEKRVGSGTRTHDLQSHNLAP